MVQKGNFKDVLVIKGMGRVDDTRPIDLQEYAIPLKNPPQKLFDIFLSYVLRDLVRCKSHDGWKMKRLSAQLNIITVLVEKHRTKDLLIRINGIKQLWFVFLKIGNIQAVPLISRQPL